MKKLFRHRVSLVIASFMAMAWSAGCVACHAEGVVVPSDIKISAEKAGKMLSEADDFIDDMPEGLQDRQADAVRHAIHDNLAELESIRFSRSKAPEMPDNVECTDLVSQDLGMMLRLYRPSKAPSDSPLPLLVYLHGGGWTFGGINSCARFCAALAAMGNVMVLAPEYALAPENPYPCAVMECGEVLKYAIDHAEEWGGSKELVSLGGDSSGGNLAIEAAMFPNLSGRGYDNAAVRSLVLFYPVTKAYPDKSESWKKYSKGYGLDGRLMTAFIDSYLLEDGYGLGLHKATLSPGDADDSLIKKLPPTLLVGASRDILADQGKEFAGRLKENSVDCTYVEFPGAVHLFITVDGQPTAFETAVKITDEFLR